MKRKTPNSWLGTLHMFYKNLLVNRRLIIYLLENECLYFFNIEVSTC